MTTADLLFDSTASRDKRPLAAAFRPLRRIWEGFKRRREERKLIIALTSLDDHLLRDIGIEPMDVIDALNGRPAPSITFNPMRRRAEHE